MAKIDRATSLLHVAVTRPIKKPNFLSVKNQTNLLVFDEKKKEVAYLAHFGGTIFFSHPYIILYILHVNSHITFAMKQYYPNAFQTVKNSFEANLSNFYKIVENRDSKKTHCYRALRMLIEPWVHF